MTKDKNELMEIADQMEQDLGTDNLLEDLMKAMSSDELQDNLAYISRMYDLDNELRQFTGLPLKGSLFICYSYAYFRGYLSRFILLWYNYT